MLVIAGRAVTQWQVLPSNWGHLEMTLHGDFVLFDERHRNIGKVDHLRRYGAQKQTSQPTKAACPHHDLIGHGFARDAVNRLGGGRCLDVASRAQVMGQQFRLAFYEIGTSQRNTEVPLTHRWRELDSKISVRGYARSSTVRTPPFSSAA